MARSSLLPNSSHISSSPPGLSACRNRRQTCAVGLSVYGVNVIGWQYYHVTCMFMEMNPRGFPSQSLHRAMWRGGGEVHVQFVESNEPCVCCLVIHSRSRGHAYTVSSPPPPQAALCPPGRDVEICNAWTPWFYPSHSNRITPALSFGYSHGLLDPTEDTVCWSDPFNWSAISFKWIEFIFEETEGLRFISLW
jgi:hypothetical protein